MYAPLLSASVLACVGHINMHMFLCVICILHVCVCLYVFTCACMYVFTVFVYVSLYAYLRCVHIYTDVHRRQQHGRRSLLASVSRLIVMLPTSGWHCTGNNEHPECVSFAPGPDHARVRCWLQSLYTIFIVCCPSLFCLAAWFLSSFLC